MKLNQIKSKADIRKEVIGGYLIDADEKSVRSIIASLKQRGWKGKVAVVGRDNEFNRRMIEKTDINYLVSPELGFRKDSLKQRDSGLNHIVAKVAAKRNIGIVVDFDSVVGVRDRKGKALRLGRILQNVRVCRRAGCKMLIWGGADVYSLRAFGFSLGMSSQQISTATKDL